MGEEITDRRISNMRNRQVHLDFHTSGLLSVGKEFSKEQFAAMLKAGHVDSITVFSKCHHGWSYHPTNVNETHPGLDFDLLGAELEVCRELNVNAPVYISAGYDEKELEKHPEWLLCYSRNPEDNIRELREGAHFHRICFNSPYLDFLCAQIEEVMEIYNPCGIFLDIVAPTVCHCERCVADMKKAGLDPDSDSDCVAFSKTIYEKYVSATNSAVRKHSSTASIFHNSGHISKDYPFMVNSSTHLEIESLPTGGWGYDHFPMSAAFARTTGKEYLGMTGKFHGTWGEFGGFKHPNALIYETSLSLALGAGCSVGDQLHSSGKMNESTYNLIGSAYALIEEKEKYTCGMRNFSDIAVLSGEALCGRNKGETPDTGANRMLLEGHQLYDFIDGNADFGKYDLIILPGIQIDNLEIISKLRSFAADGGKIIAAGLSGINNGKFFLDFGAEYGGASEFSPTYSVPYFDTSVGRTEFVMKCDAQNISVTDGRIVCAKQNPFFNRTREHFCSHQQAPNDSNASFPGVVIKRNLAYICWDVFSGYASEGHLIFKEIFNSVMNEFYPNGTRVVTDMPDRGVVTLMTDGKNQILHLLYAHTTVRGRRTEVIEDTVPLFNITCSVAMCEKPSEVTLVPENRSVDFTYSEGRVSFTVPKVNIHQMVKITC